MVSRLWPVALVVLGAALALPTAWQAMAKVDEPAYETIRSEGDIEVRRYAPMIVAEVTRSGSRRSAINAGFRVLADYIFGANVPAEKIAMTAPVTQTPAGRGRDGEKIDMTAPVTQMPAAGGAWRVGFVMPEGYTMETLPKPRSPDIRLRPVPERTVAAIRLSGIPGSDKLERKTRELRGFMEREGLTPSGDPTYAFYDPPWTLPFLRRHEVLLEVAR